MSDPIRIGGFFSSFDTESVIAQLTQARMRAVTRSIQSVGIVRKSALAGSSRSRNLLSKLNALLG